LHLRALARTSLQRKENRMTQFANLINGEWLQGASVN
jgi:hypothetical protein